VYLDFAAAITRYGKIEAGKEGKDHASQEEISPWVKKW
jgi:succinate dehydrogenase / fumarate reductase flavoprotein subunit